MLKALMHKLGFLRPSGAALSLYEAAVDEARRSEYYQIADVSDTVDGRFDMITLFVSLVIHRIGSISGGGGLSQELFDVMFADMKENLREIGVSDEGMKYRIREMAGSFMGRMRAYNKIQSGREDTAETLKLWELAISRNVFRTSDNIVPGATMLAKRVMAVAMSLKNIDDDFIFEGKIDFPALDGDFIAKEGVN